MRSGVSGSGDEEFATRALAQGDVVVVRYADDIIRGFQHQTEADRSLENFRERLGKLGLELHPDKTRRIEFGRFAEQNRERRGKGKPETFDFLGYVPSKIMCRWMLKENRGGPPASAGTT